MKFDMSEAWREATAMIGANREVLLIVAGIFFFLPNMLLAFQMPDMDRIATLGPDQAEAAVLQLYGEIWWVLLIVVLAGMIGYLALLALLRDKARPTVGEAIRVGVIGLLPAIGTYIVFVLGTGLIFGILIGAARAAGSSAVTVAVLLLCLVGFVYASVKSSLSAPVIAIERVFNPFRVLARSWRLTKGNSLRLFGFAALILIVYVVISAVAGLILGAVMLALGDAAYQVLNALVSGALSTVVAVLAVALLASIHRQLAGDSTAELSETFE